MPSNLTDLSTLCVHTMTTKPLGLAEAAKAYAKAGVPGISVWRQHLEPVGPAAGRALIADAGLETVSLCRGGFFPAETEAARNDALDDNRRAIDEAAELGAPLVVLVCGAVPGMPLEDGRRQIRDGIASLLPYAESAGVRLAIEPLHPVYADSRSAINTLGQANDMVEAIGGAWLGVTVDVYHLWWDSSLEVEIARAGESIFSFHMCDWRTPTRDLLNDRGLMGEGCIDVGRIRGWVETAGFKGYNEVEIFSDEFWGANQIEYIERIKAAYLAHG